MSTALAGSSLAEQGIVDDIRFLKKQKSISTAISCQIYKHNAIQKSLQWHNILSQFTVTKQMPQLSIFCGTTQKFLKDHYYNKYLYSTLNVICC